MGKIALITDLHLDSYKNDDRIWNYYRQFYDNIFFPYLNKHNIKEILILGDVIDNRKSIDFKVLQTIKNEFFDKLNQYQVNIILGNHDIYYKNTNEVSSIVNICKEYKNITVHVNPTELAIHGLSFLLLPWINDENKSATMAAIERSESDYVCAHLEINGAKMTKTRVCEKGLDKSIFSKFQSVWSGHFHHRNKQGNVEYIGNPYQMNFGDCNDERGFNIFDTETNDLSFIENPYKLYEKIYYEDKVKIDFTNYKNKFVKLYITQKTNSELLVNQLYDNGAYHVNVIENFDYLESDIDVKNIEVKSTLSIFNEYIDSIDDVDKVAVKTQIKDIYDKALLELVEV